VATAATAATAWRVLQAGSAVSVVSAGRLVPRAMAVMEATRRQPPLVLLAVMAVSAAPVVRQAMVVMELQAPMVVLAVMVVSVVRGWPERTA